MTQRKFYAHHPPSPGVVVGGEGKKHLYIPGEANVNCPLTPPPPSEKNRPKFAQFLVSRVSLSMPLVQLVQFALCKAAMYRCHWRFCQVCKINFEVLFWISVLGCLCGQFCLQSSPVIENLVRLLAWLGGMRLLSAKQFRSLKKHGNLGPVTKLFWRSFWQVKLDACEVCFACKAAVTVRILM